MLDKDAIKESLTNDQIIELMQDLGTSYTYKSGKLVFKTICHEGKSEKLYYYGKGNFYCYSECGALDIYQIVMNVMSISTDDFIEAVKYVAKICGIKTTTTYKKGFHHKPTSDWDAIKKYRLMTDRLSHTDNTNILPIFNINILNMFSDVYYQPWIDEGITIETMRKYQIKYCNSRNKIVIPHFNIDGDLVGLKGRALNNNEIEAGYKYMPLMIQKVPYAFSHNLNLFGLHTNKNAIQSQNRAILTEAEKSVMQTDGWYGENNITLATCNSSFSIEQRKLLIDLNVNEITLAPDKEYTHDDYLTYIEDPEIKNDFTKFRDKILKIAHMLTPYMKVYVILDTENLIELKDSPTDKGQEVFEHLLNSRVEITTR